LSAFETKVFDRYSRTEKALVNAIIESYLQGVSTRNIENVISRLGVNQLSASYVSKVGRELDAKVQEFMKKPLDSHYPYLFIDASYFKVRDETRYVNKALLVIIGVQTDGHREVLATRVADAECELNWEGRFSDLKNHGLAKVDLIVSDGHTGLPEECSRAPPGSQKSSPKHHKEIADMLKEYLTDSGKLQ
jgi:transposase-like protein